MGAVMKRVVQLGINSATKINVGGFAPTSSLVSKLQSPYGYRRHLSHIVNPNGIVDTLAVVRSLEAKGVPSKKAEAITYALTEVLSDGLKHLSDTYVSRADMQKTMMPLLSKFGCEVQSFQVKNLESHGASSNKVEAISLPMVQVLNNNLENVSSKYVSKVEMDKNVKLRNAYFSTFNYEIQDSQERHILKLELEKSKLRNYLEKMNDDLTRKIDHDINGLKVQLEGQKDDMKAQFEAVKVQLKRQTDEMKIQLEGQKDDRKTQLEGQKNDLKAQLKAAKLDVLKHSMAMLVLVSVATLSVVQIWS